VVKYVSKLERLKRLAVHIKDAVVAAIYPKFGSVVTGIALMRARREEEVSVGYAGVAACIMAGVIMAVAKPLATWITGIDVDNPGGGMPPELASMVSKLLTLVTYLGVVLMVLGLIWAGINLARRGEEHS
jgi:hypothetical protein